MVVCNMSINRYLVYFLNLGCSFFLLAFPVFAQDSSSVVASAKVDVKKSFTDNLAQENKNGEKTDKTSQNTQKNRETWLESLISRGTGELFKSQDKKAKQAEKKRIAKVLKKKHSNAAHFDISGIRLRMSPQEVAKIMFENGYKRLVQDERIPNFIKWRSEELCRIHGVIGYEKLTHCSKEVAKTNGFTYVAREIYSKQETRENIEILYTSTFTDNLSHYISYSSHIPFSDSRASQNIYINNIKIYDFWRRIDARYGQPDNTTEIKWGLGGRKPYLKASTGHLELVDPLLKDLDMSRMLNEDSRLANTPYYTF